MKNILISISMLVLSTSLNAQSLSLDSCKYYALENNLKLKESKLEVQVSQQLKKDAFTKYFPKIEAGVFAMKAQHSIMEGELPEMNLPVYDGNPMNIPTATQFAYFPGMEIEMLDYTNIGFVMAVQPIYMGGRIINGNKLAELGIDVRTLMMEMTADEVLQNTEVYYWTIVSLKQKAKTLLSYEKLLKNLKADVTVSLEAGLIQKSDLLKVEMELNKVKANKLKLENGISIVKMTLSQHMGLAYGDEFMVTDTVVNIINPTKLFVSPDEAIANRVEYKLLNKSVEAEELHKRIARGEYMPQVAVGAQAFYLDMIENESTNALGFAMINVPISDWWGGSHKLKEHKIKIEIAQNNLHEKSELLKLQMSKTYNDLNESYMQVSVAESSLKQAREHFAVVNNNFEAGLVSTSDLLESQAMLQQSMQSIVDAKTDYKMKQSLYLQAISKLN